MGQSPAGLFRFSHMFRGFSGGQAQYLRVPFADVGPIKIEDDSLRDEQVLFLSDIFPTGYMAAENCDIEPGDTVAVWGAGPVGQFAVKSAQMLGAERVIVIDYVPERLGMAKTSSNAETIDFEKDDVYDRLMDMTSGRGPDRCIDAVGCEAHAGGTLDGTLDVVKTSTGLATDRVHVLRQAIMSCRKSGTISTPRRLRRGRRQTADRGNDEQGLDDQDRTDARSALSASPPRQNSGGDIDPSFIVTHSMSLDDAPRGYQMFKNKDDSCIKIVLKPNGDVLPRPRVS